MLKQCHARPYHRHRLASPFGGRRRHGKVLVLLAVLLPTLCGIIGLVVDGGLMMREYRSLQHVSDAAATAAAVELRLGRDTAAARTTGVDFVHVANGRIAAGVNIRIPPVSGTFAGRAGFVEVELDSPYHSKFIHVLDRVLDRTIHVRAVAGVDDVTTGGAIVILDPEPDPISVDLAHSASQVNAIVLELLDERLSTSVLNQTLPQLGLGQLLNQAGLANLIHSVNSALTVSLTDLADNATVVEEAENLITETVTGLPLAPLPGLMAGLEIEGLGQLRVDGAILVNNKWGGVDENGEVVGEAPGPPYGIACMPLLPTTRVQARDLRVAGGVDRKENYRPFTAGDASPLQANRLPVPDPLEWLPPPTMAVDSTNVKPNARDGNRLNILSPGATLQTVKGEVLNDVLARVLGPLGTIVGNSVQQILKPLLGPPTENALLTLLGPDSPPLQPGVYDSIHVASLLGGVTFEPGVYIVRGGGPTPLVLLGDIRAEGVMFYITDSPTYDGISGSPDGGDGGTPPPDHPVPSLSPSAVIIPTLGSRISGLDDRSSPFHGMLLYQRRQDQRPIVIAAHHLIAGGEIAGTIYSKWGHVLFLGGQGAYNLRFVTGTMRVLTLFDTTIAPSELLPPARDVLLVE